MFTICFTRRTVAVGACAVALVASTSATAAAEGKRVICTRAYSAYKSAVEREQAGHPGEARELLATCLKATACGGLVPKCAALYDRVATDRATVVPVVTDESGQPRVDVQVKMDGQLLISKLDGRALPVEPGLHEFTFGTDRGVFATEKVQINEGQRNRLITVSMGGTQDKAKKTDKAGSESAPDSPTHEEAKAPKAEEANTSSHAEGNASMQEDAASAAPASQGQPDSEHSGRHRSALPYVLGGVGLASVAVGGVLTYWGNKDNSTLQSQCKPNCDPASVDHIRNMYIVGDIAFGVGAAALVATGWLFVTSRPTETPHTAAGYRLDVQPTRSGAYASVSGAF
jgi:hypothetical protein